VEARTLELKQAYKELDTFFYRSSHDFRRPITTFLGLAEVAKITVKDSAPLELFDKVRETAESLDRMLRKLQSISDVGAQQMVYKEVFLKELVEEILDGFSDHIHQKKIAVRLSINESHTLVSYPAMIKIIIENLIENAIHFCGTDNPYVHVKAMVHEDAATIDVEDNGQGIMEEYKSRIFEMYFRANEHSKGNGLGLYIAKKAAEKLSGQIHFTSKPFEGSLFTVSLPNRKE
jgi:signal transduction histidine kinase